MFISGLDPKHNGMRNLFSLIFSLCLITCLISKSNTSIANETEDKSQFKPKVETKLVFDVLPMNLEEIVSDSDRIFTGKCIKLKEIKKDPESKLSIIKYTFKISEGIKGVGNKKEISFKQWLPTTRESGYEIGKKYILFLYPNSEIGLTSPVGVSQGKFNIEERKFIRSKEIVKNKLHNRGLYRNLRTQKTIQIKKDKYINDYVQRCSELGIPMRYQEFIKAVKYLLEQNS